jgi:hypothetical protein
VYTVCLVMESGNNCRKEFCKQIEVRCSQPPACNFEVKFDFRRDTLNPLKVYFTNNTIVPSNAAQYLWTFGDGSSSTERNPVHTYAAPGAYKVCLKVRISNDCVRDACKEINLQPIHCIGTRSGSPTCRSQYQISGVPPGLTAMGRAHKISTVCMFTSSPANIMYASKCRASTVASVPIAIR